MPTQSQTTAAIRALGLTVNVSDGEYRVAVPAALCAGETRAERLERQEAGCYYTTDAEDALATAKAMRAALDA